MNNYVISWIGFILLGLNLPDMSTPSFWLGIGGGTLIAIGNMRMGRSQVERVGKW